MHLWCEYCSPVGTIVVEISFARLAVGLGAFTIAFFAYGGTDHSNTLLDSKWVRFHKDISWFTHPLLFDYLSQLRHAEYVFFTQSVPGHKPW